MDVDELHERIDSGDVVVVVGAGVALLATGSHPCAGWIGLLENGIEHCAKNVAGLPADWADRTRADLRSGDMDDLLSAAEKVSAKLGAPGGGDYAGWLAKTVGSLALREPSVLHALAVLGCPILTTNYDDLIERATGLPHVTWRQSGRVELALRDKTKRGVVHLHGHWADPESVVLGIRSYEKVLSDQHAQAILRALLASRTLLYVGFGTGLRDPNFRAFRRWAREVFASSPYSHFRLAREGDVAEVQKEHPPEERIRVLSYGPEYSDLAGFLAALAASRSHVVSHNKLQQNLTEMRRLHDNFGRIIIEFERNIASLGLDEGVND